MALAMIDGIRRRFGKTTAGGTWDFDQELKPDTEDTGLPTDASTSTAPYASGRYAPDNDSTPDYYKSLVQTAIENGGRHGDHSISIPWLRMILAGLESKKIELRMMWYGVEAGESEEEGEIPSYEHLFRSSRDALAALR